MIRKILFLVTFFFFLISSVVAAEDIRWQNYSGAIFDQAKKQHRLVLLYGKSEWCHWCQKMDGNTWNDSSVIQTINTHFIPVKVDINDDNEIANHYNIKGTPTLVIVDWNRRVVKTLFGYEEPYDLVNNLKEILNQYTRSSR